MLRVNQLIGFGGVNRLAFKYEGQGGPVTGSGTTATITSQSADGDQVLVFVGWGDNEAGPTQILSGTFGGNAMSLRAESSPSNDRYFGAACFSIAGPQTGNIALTFGKSNIDIVTTFVISLYRAINPAPSDTDDHYAEAGGIAPNLDNLDMPPPGGLRFGLLWDNVSSGSVTPSGCKEIDQGAGTFGGINHRYLLAYSAGAGTMTHDGTSSVLTAAAGVSWR